jgi:hypothetical protein
MALPIWDMAASRVATYIRDHRYRFRRGLLIIPRFQEEMVIAWVFGNCDGTCPEPWRHDVDLIRRRVQDTAVEELGFGFSEDGRTWTLILKADNRRYQTPAGKALHLELLKASLDEAVRGTWQAILEVPGENLSWRLEKYQPAAGQ